MSKVTIEKLFRNRFKAEDTERGKGIERPNKEDQIGLRNYYCFTKLQEDISRLVKDKKTIEVFDSEANGYVINISTSHSDTELETEPKEPSYISISIQSGSLDYVNILLEDQRAERSIKKFHINIVEGSNKGGEDYTRVKEAICQYLRDGKGSWILKKE